MPAAPVIDGTHMLRYLGALIARGVIGVDDRVLAVFAGAFDAAVYERLSLTQVVLSNLEPSSESSRLADGLTLDVRSLPFGDGEFDHVIAHAGIHHCSEPHRAVAEMYRVASRSVLFFEPQDSVAMRMLERFGVLKNYELQAVVDGGGTTGGVDGSSIPNHVYRWTVREIRKTLASLDPAYEHEVEVDRCWDLSPQRLAGRLSGTPLRRLEPFAVRAAGRSADVVNRLIGRQGNSLAVLIRKDLRHPQPWIDDHGDEIRFRPGSLTGNR